MAAQEQRFYLPRLDVMRFFSFLAVFLFHVAFWEGWIDVGARGISPTLRAAIFNSGRFGVDLFFTLSAYLITELLMREKDQASTHAIDLKSFYIRRILRIWPLYFTVLTGIFVGTHICKALNVFHALPSISFCSFWAAACFSLNFFFVAHTSEIGGLIAHLWSISVEEQFYLVWPLIVRYLTRRNLRAAGLCMLALTNVLRILAVVLCGARGPAIWFNTFLRLDPIAGGILIAALLDGRTDWPVLRRLGAPLLVGGSLLWIGAGLCPLHNNDGGALATILAFPAAALGSAAFLLATIGASRSTARIWTSSKFTRWGQISYGLYVFHYPILGVIGLELKRVLSSWLLGLTLPLVAFVLTVIFASFTYEHLERPFLRLKSRFQHVKALSAEGDKMAQRPMNNEAATGDSCAMVHGHSA
jgi:peptidoglycan/LPS O-acetylase OafA/YrhL